MSEQISDTAIKATTYLGATTGILGGLALSEWLAVIGVIMTAFGVAVNFWHKRTMIRIERERLQMDRDRMLR